MGKARSHPYNLSVQTQRLGILLLLGFTLAAQPIDPPVVKKQVEPRYPDDLKFYLTDHPTVKLTIDKNGEPFSIESPIRIPDNVVKAIRQSRFEPAHQGKRAVSVTMELMLPVRRPLSEALGLGRTSSSITGIADANKTAKGLDDAGEANIEHQIEQNPADVQAHLVAVRYWNYHDSPANEPARLRQLKWFAEISPRYGFLGMPGASPRWEEKGSDDYEALRKLWIRKLAENPADQAILDNATNFLRIADPAEAENALLKAAKTTDHAMNLLGDLYAFAGMGVTAVDPFVNVPAERSEQQASSPFAVRSRETLLKTENLRLLFSGLHTVSGAGDTAFCTALLERAKRFYPQATANCGGAVARKPGGAVVAATRIKSADPDFPPEARSRGIYDSVTLQASIGKDGKAHDIEMRSGAFIFYDAARAAVQKWEFRPTTLNGEPVDILATMEVNFAPPR